MKNKKYLFTSESVSEGHPDKLADKISDSILDAYIEKDPYAKVACETLLTTNTVVVSGEINSTAVVDVEQIIRAVLSEIGYTDAAIGINGENCQIINLLDEQSPDIAQGVDNRSDKIIGAGDQGIMFGYAEDSNDYYMPLPIMIAHHLMKLATKLRKNGQFVSARPDMKSQVTLAYETAEVTVDTIVMSIQHAADFDEDSFFTFIKESIIEPTLRHFNIKKSLDFKLFLNPTGRFVIGGPHGDTGLTGRKIIVDTYGGYARHGGGAFSGKDATKVDRSGAYMARYLAKNIVASKLAKRCEIQLAYAIGVAEPVAIYIDAFGSETIEVSEIERLILTHVDLTPQGIIERFNMRTPIYAQTATFGHFGRIDIKLPWEALDLVAKFTQNK